MATVNQHGMNPYASLPAPRQRRGVARVVDLSVPPLEGDFVAAGPGMVAIFEGMEYIKPLRGDKEPLPEADAVDPEQILSPTADALELPGAPDAAGALEPHDVADEARLDVDFDAGSYGNPGTIPPDTHGAPGPRAVVTMLNNRARWQDRAGAILRDVTLDQFWNVFGTPVDTFDPKLFYDALAGRFIAVVCGDARTAASAVMVAVSKSDDPMGDWVFGRITVDPETMDGLWLDYPSVGFTDDKITVSLNLFTNADNRFRGVAIFVVDKRAFVEAPHDFLFDQFVVDDQGATMCPAIVQDADVSDQYLVSNWSGNDGGKGYLALFRISGRVADDNVTFDRIGYLEIDRTWSSRGGNIAPQKGSATRIDTGDARMQWVVQRHGRLYLAHTVFLPQGAPARSAVQWAEVDLRGTPAVTVHGVIDDAEGEEFFAHPSLAVNDRGDVLIGMSVFSRDIYGSGAFAYRPSGGMFGARTIYAAGQNSYHLTHGGTSNRWGDYSATHVDPINDRDFWTIQEHADAVADRWRTRWGRVLAAP